MKKKQAYLAILLTLSLLILTAGAYYVYQFFSGNLPTPQSLKLGPVEIRLYSVCILLGVLSSYTFAFFRAKKYNFSPSIVDDLLLLGVPLGLISTRLAYVLLNLPYYLSNPIKILYIWEGGLTLHGGIIVAVLILYFYTRAKKISPWRVGDAFAPALFIAEGVGRWGNFFNQELIGYPTTGLFKMFITPAFRPWGYQTYTYFHPVFLYQSVANFLLLGLVLYLEHKKKFKEGEVLLSYFFLHSLSRLLVEFLRIEPRVFINLSLAQLVSLAIMLTTAIIFVLKRRTKPLLIAEEINIDTEIKTEIDSVVELTSIDEVPESEEAPEPTSVEEVPES